MVNAVSKSVGELGIKAVLGHIVSALFLLFFITTGVQTIQVGNLLIGLLYFASAILILIPHQYLKVTKPLKLIFLVIIYSVLAVGSGVKPAVIEQKYENFTLGQPFKLVFSDKNFSMLVRETSQDTKIKVGENEVTTSGFFLVVKADITNQGSEAVDFKFASDPVMRDDQDRLYTLYGAALNQGKLQPSVAKELSFVFEIPKEATGLRFILKDKTDLAKSVDLKR